MQTTTMLEDGRTRDIDGGTAKPSNNDLIQLYDNLIASGCVLESAEIDHSVVSNNVFIKDGASVRNSVIMDGVNIGKGARIQNAIIDKDVNIPAGEKIGFDPDKDKQKFVLTTSGIVIVAKKTSL